MADIDAVKYARFVLQNTGLSMRWEYWRAYEQVLIFGKRRDPDSFDRHGRPSTDPDHEELGYYPLYGVPGVEVLWLPCWDRLIAVAEGDDGDGPNPPDADLFRVEGRPLVTAVPAMEVGAWAVVCLPIVKYPVSSVVLNQSAACKIPFDDSRQIFLQAIRHPGEGLEIFFTSTDPLLG